jgi:hypothetical protein
MKYKLIVGALFLIITFFITNNKGMAMADRSYDYYREKLKEVNISDGVSKEEAITIAQNYVIDMIEEGKSFYKKLVISKSSILEEWESEKDWAITVPIRCGLALISPTEYILFVNKMTGKVIPGGERK